MLKLLPKSEIQKAKALDRKIEIDEGMKLAKRVDALRETAADEEASLEAFRHKTLEAIHTQITDASRKKATLEKEVSILEEQRRKALVPLDNEWKRLLEVQEYDENLKKDLMKRSAELEKLNKTVAQREKMTAEKERTAAIREDDAIRRLQEADRRQDEAAKIKKKSEADATRLLANVQKSENDLEAKRKTLDRKEQDNLTKEKELEKLRKHLENEERKINDKYQTLLRTTTRIYGKRPKR